jgi:putative inorganic carbon (HCO3(-)) transporter
VGNQEEFAASKRSVGERRLTIGAWETARAGIWKIQRYGLVLITFMSFFPTLFHLEEYLFFVLLFVALITAGTEGRPSWVRTSIDLPLLLFVSWVLLTIPFAIDPAYSFSEWRKLVAQVLVFYWAMLVMKSQPNGTLIREVLWAALIGAGALCIFSLIDFFLAGGTWKNRSIRAGPPFSNANALGTCTVMVIPLLVVMVLNEQRRLAKIGAAFGLGLTIMGMYFSFIRAAWLGGVVQIVAAGLFNRRKHSVLLALGCCALVVAGLYWVSLATAPSSIGSNGSLATLHLRLVPWKLALGDVVEHPVFGVGYGNYTFKDRHTVEIIRILGSTEMVGPHSTYVMVAMGSGIPALLLLLWLFAAAIQTLVITANRILDRPTYRVTLAIALMIVGFAVRNGFDYMFTGGLGYLLWVLVGVGITEGLRNRSIAEFAI